jgi:hypothetical protein
MDAGLTVFLLEHVYTTDDGEQDAKTIGVYATREAAEKATRRLRLQPGFSSRPEGSNIDAYEPD